METTRLWLERSNKTDDVIVMETTRLWLEEGNITDDVIALVQQNFSKICRKKSWKTQASELWLCHVSRMLQPLP